MSSAPHRVCILVLPSTVPFDFGVASQVFDYPRGDLGAVRYRVTHCTPVPGAVMTRDGFAMHIARGLSALRYADTIVVPGIDDLDIPIAPAALRALRSAHARGTRLLSICTGAFVLAAAGVLDGRRATTHWMDVPEFRRRFPQVHCDPDVLYVDEGSVLTSAGIAAGIDLCLHAVRLDHGARVANAVARRMVISPHRRGGQAQFIPYAMPAASQRPLDATRMWALARLSQPLTLHQLATHARMSVRTFSRHFRAESGTTPLQWLLTQRLTAAQQLLEDSDLSVEQVAARCGFGSAITLRMHFRRDRGVSPLTYRQAFRATKVR